MYTRYAHGVMHIIFAGDFPPKTPIISGSFAKNDLQLNASHVYTLCTWCDAYAPHTLRNVCGDVHGPYTLRNVYGNV